MPVTRPTVMGLYMEGRRGDDLGADNIALHHHGDGASPRVFAGKLGFNETTVGKVLEKAKAQAQSDLFIDHLTTLDQQAKNEAAQYKPGRRQGTQ